MLVQVVTLELESTYEVGCFDETEAESNSYKPPIRLTCCSASGDGSPDDHCCWKVDSWLANLVEEKVGWNLHEKVSYKQNTDRSLFVISIMIVWNTVE